MTDSNATADHVENASNPLVIGVNIFTAPSEAFSVLRDKPTFLYPLATIILSIVAVFVWYFSVLDYAWYVDNTVAQIGADMSADERDSLRSAMQSISPRTTMLLGTVSASVMIVIIAVLHSAYLSLISSVTGNGIRFRQWFSAVCWTNLPGLLSAIGMAITIMLDSSGQISSFELDPLALANLGLEFPDNSSLNQLASSINLTLLWSLSLLILAYRQWLQVSLLKAGAVVAAPYVLIFGTLAYFAFN